MSWDHPGGGLGGGIYQVFPSHTVLDLPMSCLLPHHQVCIAIRAADLLEDSLLVSETLYCQPEAIGLRGVTPYCAAELESHTRHIANVSVQPNPVKQLRQDIKHLL